jgi:hypothetical protein
VTGVMVYYERWRDCVEIRISGAAMRSSDHISDLRSFRGWWVTGGG